MQTAETLDLGMKKAGEILDAGMFWRGNLAKAVKRRDFRGTAWGIGGLSLVLFLYVWLHMQVVKVSYEVQGLKQQKQQLTNEYYYLKYKMNDVNSLSRSERVARERLGMVTPRSDQIVILEDDSDAAPGWLAFWENMMKRLNGK